MPLAPHRATLITACFACAADLRETVIEGADGLVVRLQAEAERILAQGWGVLNEWPLQRPFHYFDILRRVLGVLNGRHGRRLREVVMAELANRPAEDLAEEGRRIEYLSVERRHFLMLLAAQMMEDWPHRFVGACQSAGISWGRVKRRDNGLASAFQSPIKTALRGKSRDHMASPAKGTSKEDLSARYDQPWWELVDPVDQARLSWAWRGR